MTRGARIAPLLVVLALLPGGAAAHHDRDVAGVSATAACVAANEKVAGARKAVKRAKRALRRAETRRAKARARRKLKKAKRRLANALAEQKKTCANPPAPNTTPPPPAPQVGGTSPGSPSNSNNVMVKGTAQSGTTVKLFTSANCAGAPVATGPASQFGSGGLPATVPDNSTTTFRGTATNAGGGVSPCSASSVSYTEDSLAPAPPTFTGTSPPSPADDTSPEITGTAEPGSTVKLYNDPGCASPPSSTGPAAAFGAGGLTVNVAPNSTTTFRATATDQAGNTSPCSSNSIVYTQQPPNQPPTWGAQQISAVQNNTYAIILGVPRLTAQTLQLTLSPGATDPDGDPLTYTWEASNGTITGAGLSATWVRVVQNYQVVPGTVTVTASDGRGGSAAYTF